MLISATTFPIAGSHRGSYPFVDIRINQTSMVPTCFHNPRLLLLTRDNISYSTIRYVAQKFIYAIQIDDQWTSTVLPSPPPTPTKPRRKRLARHVPLMPAAPLPALEVFIAGLVEESGAKVATLLSTLIYLHRFRTRMSADVIGDPGTRHRIFLATLIVAAKYLNDSGPKNVHWTQYARCFDIAQVNAMETELLTILDYELRFDEAEACRHFGPLMNSYNDNQNLVRQPTIFSVSSKSNRAPQQVAAARYHGLPLTPPPSEGCISATTTLPHFPHTSLPQISANTPPGRFSRLYRHPANPFMPSVGLKTRGGLDGGGDGVPVSTNPSSWTPIGNKKTGSEKMQRQSEQTIQQLHLPQSDEPEPEPETRPDNNNNSRLSSMFRGVPAAMAIGRRRRKSHSLPVSMDAAAAAAAIPVKNKTHEKKRSDDLAAGIAQQCLSATKPPESSRTSKGQLDDLWRKIQLNLSKLALTNASDTEPGISAVLDRSKRYSRAERSETELAVTVC